MAQRVSLNLYLLKDGVAPSAVVGGAGSPGGIAPTGRDDPEAATWIRTWLIGEEPTEAPLPVEADGPPSLLVRSSPVTHAWHSLLQGFVPDLSLGEDQAHFGALLFQPIGARVAVWSFGNAWSLLDTTMTVERFGLRAGLNALLTAAAPATSGRMRPKPVGVRNLTSAIRASVVRKSTVVAARPSAPTVMERVDQSSDAAAMAELTTHHPTFDRVAAGRSMRFDAPVGSMADLVGYATEAIRLYERDDYTKDDAYKWIDYTVPVGDPAEVDRVLDELLMQATAAKPLSVDLVWADADQATGLTPSFFCFPKERSSAKAMKRKEMTWAGTLAWLLATRPGEAGRRALRTNLRFFVEGVETPSTEDELWRFAVAQVSVGGDTYVISDGEVWRASRSHIADIDNLLLPRVTVNPPWLPSYVGGESEDSYNRRAAVHGHHFLLDKSLVRLPGQTSFEPCDLLSSSGYFMHVKRKTSSATMSHVVAQAVVSTQLLRSNAMARDLLDQALLKESPPPTNLKQMRDHCASFAARPTATVLVVIVGTWRNPPDVTQLPLLTRISLNNWLRQMPCEAGIVLVGT
jgi:uncharacterized protein (TIGR04141 family)